MTITERPIDQAPPITTVPLRFGADDIDNLDIADPTIVSDTLEHVDIGGAGPLFGRYLRVEADDLVEVADALRRLADRIIVAVIDARDEKLDAERHDCFCGVRLEPDEVTCGSAVCNDKACTEAWADAHSRRF